MNSVSTAARAALIPQGGGRFANSRTSDLLVHILFVIVGATGVILLGLIMLFLIMEGLPIFEKISIADFIFGMEWYPTYFPPDYGILPMIAGTASVVGLSMLFAIPLGVGTAFFLAEIASPRVRGIVKPVVELIEGLPTVVIGFFGMVVVAPWMQNTFGWPTGLNLLNASLMLAFMAVPTIASIAEDAIYSVPKALSEAALALGATRLETMTSVVVPAALTGISTACVLGVARAAGETMVVLMVAGGAAIVPESIFDPIRPMPANIAAEMGNAPFRSDHYHALFAIGMVLFFITFMFNMIVLYFANKHRQFE